MIHCCYLAPNSQHPIIPFAFEFSSSRTVVPTESSVPQRRATPEPPAGTGIPLAGLSPQVLVKDVFWQPPRDGVVGSSPSTLEGSPYVEGTDARRKPPGMHRKPLLGVMLCPWTWACSVNPRRFAPGGGDVPTFLEAAFRVFQEWPPSFVQFPHITFWPQIRFPVTLEGGTCSSPGAL